MIKRILLIDVDLFRNKLDTDTLYYSHHPIGLLYLVSAVNEEYPQINFQVFHTPTSPDPIKSVESLMLSFKPDLVGLRALSIAKQPFHLIAQKIRELSPDIPIIAGGPYPSTSYNDILQNGLVDMAVIGEGEITFVELIKRLQQSNDIPDDLLGTIVFKNGMLKINSQRPLIQNVDAIPFPNYDYINLSDYEGIMNHALKESTNCAFIFSSRGCPYGCFYCHQLFGKKIRHRSAENVVAEMKQHTERGIFDFVFLDDLFNVPMAEAKKVLSLIIKELPEVRINFPNGLRADFIDEEMLDLFEQAGTVEMALAVETAVPRLQKLMGKNLNIEKAKVAIQSASKRFITRIFFIIGFPSETYEEALETINFASSFDSAAQPTLSLLRLYNNSRLFDILQPTEEQCLAIAEQEKKLLHLTMFDEPEFYGDFFSDDKVPLKKRDLKELIYLWMRNVIMNPVRIKQSHEVLKKFLTSDEIMEFYRNVYDKPKFNDKDLRNLLKF
jgi:anaerobic magnesium-protoporphyrin IX monomethyl ester cyclase